MPFLDITARFDIMGLTSIAAGEQERMVFMLAQTPPMGWNSWNTFGPNISETLILEMADAMVEMGFRDAGYEYLVIDDCWSLRERDAAGHLVPDPEKFPHGMKFVADYVHSKGLKFGMYSAAGSMTCAGYPGSFGHEYADAQQFADWGVDFLKYDLCHYPGCGDVRNSYLKMSMALRATGREILFSGCTVGEHEPWDWMRSVGAHMYRSTGDICDNYESFRGIAQSQLQHFNYSGPGCFNDIDMLVVGMSGTGNVSHTGGCTDEEYLMHFSLWCLWGAPLMMGGDIRNMNEYCRNIMLNKELIAINQDPEARPPYYEPKQRYASDARMGLLKLLSNGEMVVAYYNFSEGERSVLLYFDDYGVPGAEHGLELTDILTGECIGTKYDFYCPTLPAHSFKIYKAKLVKR